MHIKSKGENVSVTKMEREPVGHLFNADGSFNQEYLDEYFAQFPPQPCIPLTEADSKIVKEIEASGRYIVYGRLK